MIRVGMIGQGELYREAYRALSKNQELQMFPFEVPGMLTVDYLVCISYPRILTKKELDEPKYGCINIHPAPLPSLRGRNVFAHSILNGRRWHGVYTHWMTEEIDGGDLICWKDFEVDEDWTAKQLYDVTRIYVTQIAMELAEYMVSGKIRGMGIPQDSEGHYYDRHSLNGLDYIPVDKLDTLEAYNIIRAFDFPPHPPAYTIINGQKIYLTKEMRT
jgi:methionyl-tRNA formyltransferase